MPPLNDYAGGVVGEIIFSTCYIDLFAVKKKCRNKGIGRELFNKLEYYMMFFLTQQNF
ncbi:GNAT family N-acetyltransferase [Enterococcus faecalis]|nr:GNAT family N-acetyltransferase [Enterococcus faecalis]